jgi:hypothetical protein
MATLDPHYQIDRGLGRVELLTKLVSGFVACDLVLDRTDQLILLEMLQEAAVDIRAGQNRMIEDDNRAEIQRRLSGGGAR